MAKRIITDFHHPDTNDILTVGSFGLRFLIISRISSLAKSVVASDSRVSFGSVVV